MRYGAPALDDSPIIWCPGVHAKTGGTSWIHATRAGELTIDFTDVAKLLLSLLAAPAVCRAPWLGLMGWGLLFAAFIDLHTSHRSLYVRGGALYLAPLESKQ